MPQMKRDGRQKLLLRKGNNQDRQVYAKLHRNWTEYQKHRSYGIMNPNWKFSNQEPSVKHSGASVKVWCSTSGSGNGELVKIEQVLCSLNYKHRKVQWDSDPPVPSVIQVKQIDLDLKQSWTHMWAVGRSRLAFAEPKSQHYWSSVGLSRQRTEQKAGKIQGRALGLESESDCSCSGTEF